MQHFSEPHSNVLKRYSTSRGFCTLAQARVCDDEKRLRKGNVCVSFETTCVCTSAGSVHLFVSVSTRSWHCSTELCHQGGAIWVQMCVCATCWVECGLQLCLIYAPYRLHTSWNVSAF